MSTGMERLAAASRLLLKETVVTYAEDLRPGTIILTHCGGKGCGRPIGSHPGKGGWHARRVLAIRDVPPGETPPGGQEPNLTEVSVIVECADGAQHGELFSRGHTVRIAPVVSRYA